MKIKYFSSVFFISISFLFLFSHHQCKAQSPHLDWATSRGATSVDIGNAIVIDAQGNTYTTGSFNGTVDFDPGSATQNLVSAGSSDIFILKTDASGNYIWAKSIGSSGVDAGSSIAVSPAGNIYITGYFYGNVDFNPGPGIDTLMNADHPCNTEIFILKLDNNGNFAWARSVEGIMTVCTVATDVAYGIDIDQAENVYVTGYWTGRADFNTSQAPADTLFFQSSGSTISGDIFILKLDAGGNFIWAKQIGNALSDTGYGLHVSSAGYVYITGVYGADADFNPGPGTDTIFSHGNWDIFIMKLDTAGNYVWAKGIGGTGDDRGFAVTTDASGNIYATGHFTGTVDFDPSASVANLVTPNYARATYLLKLDPSGNYTWAKAMGGNISGGGEREGTALALDAANNIYVTGHFTETVDFNPSTLPADTFFLTAPGAWNNTDAFILKTDSVGNFAWAVSMGAAGVDRGKGIAVDATNHVYSIGYYAGTVDFDPESAIQNQVSAGSSDIYIQKLNQDPSAIPEQNGNPLLISVYPNPTESYIILQSKNITGNNAMVSVMDISGRILFQKNIATPTGELNTQIDLHEFSSGIYFVQIKSADQDYAVKVVKK